jgi:hypothetical protein
MAQRQYHSEEHCDEESAFFGSCLIKQILRFAQDDVKRLTAVAVFELTVLKTNKVDLIPED